MSLSSSGLLLHRAPWWHGPLSALLVVALFVSTQPTWVRALTYLPVFYYHHGDHLGSSNVLTDRAGEQVQRYQYAAYGGERHVADPQAYGMSRRFTGQVLDEETGL